MDSLILVEYIQKKYGKEIRDMFFDILSKTIDYHNITINLGGASSITFELNKDKKDKIHGE